MNAPKTLGFGSAQHEIFDAVQHCSADNQGLLYGPPTTHTEKSFSQLPCDSPTSHIQLQEQTGPWTNSRVPLWSRTGATPHGSRPEVRTAVRGRGAAPPAASHKGAAVRRTDGDSDIRLAGLDAATRIPAPGPEPGPTRTQAATRRRRRRHGGGCAGFSKAAQAWISASLAVAARQLVSWAEAVEAHEGCCGRPPGIPSSRAWRRL